MHPAAYSFVHSVADQAPKGRGLEIGAYDVNGSVRDLFDGVDWYGIDLRDGPGVDEVIDAADFDGEESFDLVVCTEVLEHAMDPQCIIASAWQALRPGGMVIVTCATEPRLPHDNDGNHGDFGDYYQNVDEEALTGWMHAFEDVDIENGMGDLYAVGWKK